MNNTQKYINKAITLTGSVNSATGNAPAQYASRQKQYMAKRTRDFVSRRAELSSDYVKAQAQGLIDPFYDWINVFIRLADVASKSVSETRKTDDWKEVLFPDESINYFPIGAKLITMGSTWLSVNPSNISAINATAIVQRCNASYNSYDYYGNIVTEPLCVENYSMHSNANETPLNVVLPEGYYKITAQLNDTTRELGNSKRLMLGSKPYYITGYNDFMQEFTGDRESTHLLTFTARIEEPTEADDMTNFIADGRSRSFGASMSGQSQLVVGGTTALTPSFIKDGNVVEASEEYPLTWNWSSSDERVVKVENGAITAVGAGSANVTAVLAENTNISAGGTVFVTAQTNEPYIEFLGVIPPSLKQYSSVTLDAAYYDENGNETETPLNWSFGGAAAGCYVAKVASGSLTVTVQCIFPSDLPLIITASRDNISASVEIILEGY